MLLPIATHSWHSAISSFLSSLLYCLFTASLLEEAYLICSESDMGYEMTFTKYLVFDEDRMARCALKLSERSLTMEGGFLHE